MFENREELRDNIIEEDRKFNYMNLLSQLRCISSKKGYSIFSMGYVKKIIFNNEFVYVWQNIKGDLHYSFNLLEKESNSTTATKLSNILSNHFQCYIEIVNNFDSYLNAKFIATKGVTKALSDAQRYEDYNSFSSTFQLNTLDEYQQGELNLHSSEYNISQPTFDQKFLYKDIIDLSTNRLEYNNQAIYILINELPIVHKEVFQPNMKLCFYKQNELTYKNSYIPTEYMCKNEFKGDINKSSILSFIFYMVKNDLKKAKDIFAWLAYSFNSLTKSKYFLVLHSTGDECMKLFYEEIIVPLFNCEYCEKIDIEDLDKKTLSTKLNRKVINNFHNITSFEILNLPSKEFSRRLIFKDEYKLNNQTVTSIANTIVSSTSNFIPLIAENVPCVLVEIESSLKVFFKEKRYIQIIILL